MDFLQGYYTVFDSTTDPHEIGFIPHTGSTKDEVEQQSDDLTDQDIDGNVTIETVTYVYGIESSWFAFYAFVAVIFNCFAIAYIVIQCYRYLFFRRAVQTAPDQNQNELAKEDQISLIILK